MKVDEIQNRIIFNHYLQQFHQDIKEFKQTYIHIVEAIDMSIINKVEAIAPLFQPIYRTVNHRSLTKVDHLESLFAKFKTNPLQRGFKSVLLSVSTTPWEDKITSILFRD